MVLAYNGTDIFYTDEGNGEAMVFLHGFLENTTMWQGLIPSFKKQRRVICIDLPGHGNSGNLSYIHTMEIMADAVMTVLDHLSVKRATFVGHSMGGYVSLAIAAKKEHLVQKLVLLNSTWKSDTVERKVIRTHAIAAVRNNKRAFINLSVHNLFAEKSRALLKKEIAIVRDEANKTTEQGIIAAMEGMKIRPDYAKIIQTSKFNTILIIGRDDNLIDSQKMIKEGEKLGVTTFLMDGGHMLHIENRTKVVLLLAEIVHK